MMLLETAVKVSLIASVGLVAAVMLRRRSAALRHWLLACAVACAGLAPVLQVVTPPTLVPLDRLAGPLARDLGPSMASLDDTAAAFPGQVDSAPSDTRFTPGWWAIAFWVTGAGLGLLGLGAGVCRLAWLVSRATPVTGAREIAIGRELALASGVRRPVRLLQSRHSALPLTWGLRRPDIILPDTVGAWDEERVRVVLLHELAHIRRGDWATQLAAECLRAVYWFNPLVWLLSRRLRQDSEHACDDVVLSQGVDAADYAAHLLDLARTAGRSSLVSFPAPAMARPSSFERRFRAMLSTSTNRTPLTTRSRGFVTAAVVVASLLVAGLGAAQTFSTFSGSVFDSSNRVVPSVTVSLVNPRTGALYAIKSDQDGRFEIVGLPPGDYQFEASGPGFATVNGTVTVLGVGLRKDIVLEVGSLEETMTITASRSAPARPADRPVVRGSARPAGSSRAANCEASVVGGRITPPMKLVNAYPMYPEGPRVSGLGGVVRLLARISTDGTVGAVGVIETPHPDLTFATVEAVRQWQFSQTLLNCEPVEVQMVVTANFNIQP